MGADQRHVGAGVLRQIADRVPIISRRMGGRNRQTGHARPMRLDRRNPMKRSLSKGSWIGTRYQSGFGIWLGDEDRWGRRGRDGGGQQGARIRVVAEYLSQRPRKDRQNAANIVGHGDTGRRFLAAEDLRPRVETGTAIGPYQAGPPAGPGDLQPSLRRDPVAVEGASVGRDRGEGLAASEPALRRVQALHADDILGEQPIRADMIMADLRARITGPAQVYMDVRGAHRHDHAGRWCRSP